MGRGEFRGLREAMTCGSVYEVSWDHAIACLIYRCRLSPPNTIISSSWSSVSREVTRVVEVCAAAAFFRALSKRDSRYSGVTGSSLSELEELESLSELESDDFDSEWDSKCSEYRSDEFRSCSEKG